MVPEIRLMMEVERRFPDPDKEKRQRREEPKTEAKTPRPTLGQLVKKVIRPTRRPQRQQVCECS